MGQDDKKLKILYIITKSNLGGAQRYIYDLATNTPKTQFDPIVALGGNGPLKGKLETANIKTIALSGLERDINFVKEFNAFLNIFRTIKEIKPDIVHLNSSKAGALGAIAARVYNAVVGLKFVVSSFKSLISNSPLPTTNFKLTTRIVFTVHGWAFKEKRKFFFKKIIEYISWLTVLLSHQTIVVSNDDRKKTSRFLFVQQKISVIHNGIGKLTFKDRAEARRILSEKIGHPITDNAFWIGTIAELHRNKGLEYAIGACAIIKNQETAHDIKNPTNISYIIVGKGENQQNLESAIAREGLQNTVFLAGEYPGVADLLKAFDIFLLPSLKEGLPYALLEAGAAGLPIIATNVGGVTEVIEDMRTGIVIKEKRSKEIAEAVTFLIKHEHKRKEFGERILETVQKEYTLERMVKETVEVYKKI